MSEPNAMTDSDTRATARAERRRVVDCDLHHELPSPEVLVEYLSPEWREFVLGPGPDEPYPLFPGYSWVNPHGFYREDTADRKPGSSPDVVAAEVFDAYDIDYGVLTHGAGLYSPALTNPYLAVDVCRALNDQMVDSWLSRDRRFLGSILLPSQTPDLAAAEIRRLAGKPQVVQALLCVNAVGHPFGHPLFDPIHRAAAETGLPIAIHAFGEGAGSPMAAPLSGGRPSFYIELHSGAMQGLFTHLMSFIFHGVFERYPSLRLFLLEGGVEWLPAVVGRLDVNFRGLRRETPWCKRLPSDYVRDHVRLSTQPLDVGSRDDGFWSMVDGAGLERSIVFSTDYPHWDAESPSQMMGRVPGALRDRILWQNSAEAYRLGAAPVATTPIAAGPA